MSADAEQPKVLHVEDWRNVCVHSAEVQLQDCETRLSWPDAELASRR